MAPIDTKSLDPEQALVRNLRIENRSLRRELRWNADEVKRLQEKTAELEAQLQMVTQQTKQSKVAQPKPRPKRAVKVLDTIDWTTFYLLGSGARELEHPSEATLFWDNVAVDWSGRDLPKGIVPKTKYWDRGLPLDWNADGLPTLGFKLKAQRAKAGTPRNDYSSGWGFQRASLDGGQRMSYPKQVIEVIREQRAAKAQVAEEDALVVDWSGRMPPLHKPARCNAVAGARRAKPSRGAVVKAPPSPEPACDAVVPKATKALAKVGPKPVQVGKLLKTVSRRPVSNFVRRPCARH